MTAEKINIYEINWIFYIHSDSQTHLWSNISFADVRGTHLCMKNSGTCTVHSWNNHTGCLKAKHQLICMLLTFAPTNPPLCLQETYFR